MILKFVIVRVFSAVHFRVVTWRRNLCVFIHYVNLEEGNGSDCNNVIICMQMKFAVPFNCLRC